MEVRKSRFPSSELDSKVRDLRADRALSCQGMVPEKLLSEMSKLTKLGSPPMSGSVPPREYILARLRVLQ